MIAQNGWKGGPIMAGKNNTKKNTQAEQESGKIYLAGTITTAMFGKRTFANGKSDKEEKYRLSMKLTAETMDKLKEAAEPFYVDVEEKWLPEWLTGDTDKDGGYINLSSNYDIRTGEYVNGTIVDKGGMSDYVADNGGNINGSKAVVLVIIKPGAIYPGALLIKELHKVDIGSMFNADDADFKSAFDGEDLPF